MANASMPTLLTENLTSLLMGAPQEKRLCEKLNAKGIPVRKIVKLVDNIIHENIQELAAISDESFLTPQMRIKTAQILRKHGQFQKAFNILMPCLDHPLPQLEAASLSVKLLTGFWRTNRAWSVCSSENFKNLPLPQRTLIKAFVKLFEAPDSDFKYLHQATFMNLLPRNARCFAALILVETSRADCALKLLKNTGHDPYTSAVRAIALQISGLTDKASEELSTLNVNVPLDNKELPWLSTDTAETVVEAVISGWNTHPPDFDLFRNHLVSRLTSPTGDLKEILTARYYSRIEFWRNLPGGSELPEKPFSKKETKN